VDWDQGLKGFIRSVRSFLEGNNRGINLCL
jgi:hypothetical protein